MDRTLEVSNRPYLGRISRHDGTTALFQQRFSVLTWAILHGASGTHSRHRRIVVVQDEPRELLLAIGHRFAVVTSFLGGSFGDGSGRLGDSSVFGFLEEKSFC